MEMEFWQSFLINGGNLAQLQQLAKTNQIENMFELVVAVVSTPGQLEVLQWLAAETEPFLLLNATDSEGNTALHFACKYNQLDYVSLLLSKGASASAMNKAGVMPKDLTDNQKIVELCEIEKNSNNLQNARLEYLRQIDADLPDNLPELKQVVLALLGENHLFQERCKHKLRQLIHDKHAAAYKYHLLENAAGNREQNGNYLNQIQIQQQSNEQQAANIAYLQIQSSMYEPALMKMDEFYKKSISELAEQHKLAVKSIKDRQIEFERQVSISKTGVALQISDFKTKFNSLSDGSDISALSQDENQYFQKAQNENLELQRKLKHLQKDMTALGEKLKNIQQLRAITEKDLLKIRNDPTIHRKVIQETMAKVLNETKTESDEQDENSGQIAFLRGENGTKQVKGGTPEKLAERLVHQTAFDNQYQAAFLLTFRAFMAPYALLDVLTKKFRSSDVVVAASLAGSAQNAVHLRICKIIKSWIENYWFDFQNNDDLLAKLETFLTEIDISNPKLSSLIRNAMSRKQSSKEDTAPAEKNVVLSSRPKPVVPKYLQKKYSMDEKSPSSPATWSSFSFNKSPESESDELKLKLSDLDPLEIARQLTLIEYHLFTAIKPTEFLDQAWMKADKEIKAPNICQMTKWSNHVTYWVVSEIANAQESIKQRAAVYERFIAVAHHLEKLNNFNGVKEILAALQSSAIYRLKKTQDSVNAKYTKLYENLNKLTSIEFNFKSLRSKVHAADPPLIPFPGIYQSDLVFMDTCNKSKLESGLVNFMKYQKIASYILELQVYQQTPYNLEYVGEIADYIRNFKILSEEEAYNASLKCEPRGQ